jgi:hypothetical protein
MNLNESRTYNFAAIQVNENRGVEVDSQCNAVSFLNIGATLARVNGVPLHPGVPGVSNGESFSLPGNLSEFFRGRIDVQFTGGAGSLLVIQKFYNDNL